MIKAILRVLIAGLALLLGAGPAVAAPPPKPAIAYQKIADGLTNPIMVVHAADGSGRLFILEQPGRIRVYQGGRLLETPFLDITDKVLSTHIEQGLLGLAFHPDYRANGLFFVNYTGRKSGEVVLESYRVSAADPNRADPASGQVVFTHPKPYPNHNGGTIAFGPDGYLYVGLGDGGGAGDPQNNAQSLDTLLGKILRLDVGPGRYSIPPTNPFVGGRAKGEIWDYGLRNPWRIAFDRDTGDLWIADAGQERMEEVNWERAGKGGNNYGWHVYEGTLRYASGQVQGPVFPVITYLHEDVEGCVIAGGTVYRGKRIPDLAGQYLYGDFCAGKIWAYNPVQRTTRELADTDWKITAIADDETGELYVIDRQGAVYRIVPKA